MTDTVTAALLGALAPLIGTLAYVIIERRKLRHNQQKQAELVTDVVEAVTASVVYPYSVESVRTYTTILDISGTAEVEKTFAGLRAAPGTNVRSFEGKVTTTGTFIEGPVLAFRSRSDMELVTATADANAVTFAIRFGSELAPGDPVCSFSVRHRTAAALYVDFTTIHERYSKGLMPYEFVSETVQTPMDRLEIAVDFAPAPGIHCFPNVTFGELNMTAVAERLRVESAFATDGHIVRWTIDKPKPGLRYLVCWHGIHLSA